MKTVLASFTPGLKITWLFIFLLIGVVIAGVLTNLVLHISGAPADGGVTAIYVGSVMQSVFATALPAYLIIALTQPAPAHYLKIAGNGPIGRKMLFAVLAFLFSYFLASYLAQLNKGMHLPSSLKELEQTLRSMEDAALQTSGLLLSGKGAFRLILNLVVVGGFAAVSEELFFRGALQQFLQEKYPKGHLGVWIAAFVFSVVHFQFYGFLPRLLLGVLLGYLFLYTRTLWAPILFHFINNALIVVLYYFWGDTPWIKKMESMPAGGWLAYAAAGSALCTFLLFGLYLRKTRRDKELQSIWNKF